MRVGYVGLGKLGLPCALATEHYGGHEIYGYDSSPKVQEYIASRCIPYMEEGAQELLEKTELKLCDLDTVVRESEIIFVPIQTPHEPRFEGIAPIPRSRADFDYHYLIDGIKAISKVLDEIQEPRIVVIISTVLPGTINEQVRPWMSKYLRLCYNPYFIAMGTTIPDYINPEFVLLGGDNEGVMKEMTDFYATIHDAQVFRTTIDNAELIKVAYNTFIGMKIVFANTMMEICEKTGADCDAVTDALTLAGSRLLSGRYLSGGMGDGGGCHPRDNIALSFLARKLNLSHDIFEDLMVAREQQTAWLSNSLWRAKRDSNLPIVLMGRAYKANVNLTVGSPALLLEHYLKDSDTEFVNYDPYFDEKAPDYPAIYFISTNHDDFLQFTFPEGSVVIDPWGYIPDRDGIDVMRIGRK
jgi:UDPglucose 6-dehydrogenase